MNKLLVARATLQKINLTIRIKRIDLIRIMKGFAALAYLFLIICKKINNWESLGKSSNYSCVNFGIILNECSMLNKSVFCCSVRLAFFL